MENELLDIIKTIMKEKGRTILCEAQLQLDLAWELKKSYCECANIYLEYAAHSIDKKRRYYYDIVIEHNNEYIPIELKYKTKSVPDYEYSNQAAQNLARYDFWVDVEKIEKFNTFTGKQFKNGYAILVTNDSVYSEYDGSGFLYADFAVQKGRILKEKQILKWGEGYDKNAVGKNRQRDIELKNSYTVDWKDIMKLNDKAKFEALILKVEN